MAGWRAFGLILSYSDFKVIAVQSFFKEEHKKGRSYTDLYELVQHAGNVVPRLYVHSLYPTWNLYKRPSLIAQLQRFHVYQNSLSRPWQFCSVFTGQKGPPGMGGGGVGGGAGANKIYQRYIPLQDAFSLYDLLDMAEGCIEQKNSFGLIYSFDLLCDHLDNPMLPLRIPASTLSIIQ